MYASGMIGSETVRRWLAPGGIPCTLRRDPAKLNHWQLTEGPARLVGRHWRHARDARIAVRSTGGAV
jgi:hypothetical protein